MSNPTLLCAFIVRLVNIAADLAAATYSDDEERICDQIVRPRVRSGKVG